MTAAAPGTGEIVELTESSSSLQRHLNRDLMVHWINHDLLNRAHHDVRYSTVLYDEDKMFITALPASVDVPATSEFLWNAGVRFYSRGVV